MTVIAWDGLCLSGDKRTSFGGLHGTTTKVHRIGGYLVGGCGNAAVIAEMREWVGMGCKPAEFPASQRDVKENASIIVISPSGSVYQYEHTPYPLRIENEKWAIGSGRDFALMAMYLGKTSAEAVKLTAEFCSDCGNGVDSVWIDGGEARCD